MSKTEKFEKGQEVFLKRPAQVYARVIGPYAGDFGLPEEQARLIVQLMPLEQYYLPQDLESALSPQTDTTLEIKVPESNQGSVRSDDVTSNLSAQDPFSDLAQEVNDLITSRAYELYESRGFAHGHDADDWFIAESEILLNVETDVAETEGQLAIHAKVPGFSEHELEVRVAPRSVCISGSGQRRIERSKAEPDFSGRTAHRIFRVLELPCEVDPARVEASLGDGLLEIKLPKVGLRKLVPVRAKSAAA